ncbi:MAG TPA: MaoC family dehydratase N-terminal domain-containing protein [Pseudomonadales bacterium]|nr:MaoC family dehydratase N-terminal domain-containing protein [Pseudomonadales bacterium]
MEQLRTWIGREEERHDLLGEGLLARFRATLESRVAESEGIAPRGVHWCLCTPEDAMSALGGDGHPRTGGFLPPVPLPRRMWTSGSVDFLAPLRSGAAIRRRSRVAAVSEKRSRSGATVFVELDHLTFADDAPAVRERQTLVWREAAAGMQALPGSGGADLSDWEFTRSRIPSAPLLFRYSALTFNAHRIHYDLPYAQHDEGYPALVVQAPLLATLLLGHAATRGNPSDPARFSFRAVAPAYAGQLLHLAGRETGGGTDLAAIDNDGRRLMEARLEPR